MPASPFIGVTQKQRQSLAQTKRFLELLFGDEQFNALIAGAKWDNACDIMRARGIDYDPGDFTPFFSGGLTPNPEPEACAGFPVAECWSLFQKSLKSTLVERTNSAPDNANFARWRSRQLSRLRHELGFDKARQYSPLMAIELSHGCSVQCPFCGFDAPRLTEVARYADHAELWRDMLAVNGVLFGEAAGESCLYHATEPADNEDYFHFLRDFISAHGNMPQTTTAAPLRHLAWTRKLLTMRQETPTFSDRFSLLKPDDLTAVHATFTTEELLPVSLLMQYGKRLECMTKTGRNRDSDAPESDCETIECTCGFLVNLPRRTISLISPCRATASAPTGYRTHATASFDDGQSYKRAITIMIERHMPQSIQSNAHIRLLAGLKVVTKNETNFLVSPYTQCKIGPATPEWEALLSQLQQGARLEETYAHADAAGLSLLDHLSLMDSLFKQGMLEIVFE